MDGDRGGRGLRREKKGIGKMMQDEREENRSTHTHNDAVYQSRKKLHNASPV